MKGDPVVKEMTLQCADTAAAKIANVMAEENQGKENVLVSQMKQSVSELDDELIKKMTAWEEMQPTWPTWNDGGRRNSVTKDLARLISMAEHRIQSNCVNQLWEKKKNGTGGENQQQPP